ncbi:MAG: permease-like cell division protein FtsX [Gemmatimonadota bacterium]
MMPYALREALAAFQRTPLLTALSAAMIALSLFVLGLFGIAAYNTQRVIQRVETRVEVVAYLRDDADGDAVRATMLELGQLPEVRTVRYISRDSALQIARAEIPEFEQVFAGLESNPLPASLEVAMQSNQRGPEVVEAMAERIEAYPFVESVRWGSEWLDRVFLLRRVAGAATLVLGLAFAVVAMLIIAAAVRMAVFARRDEIAIMRQVGATEGFVRRPFLLEGLLTGLLGASAAVGLTYVVYWLLSGAVFELEWLPPLWIGTGVLAGVLLGVLASAAAVRRHVRHV